MSHARAIKAIIDRGDPVIRRGPHMIFPDAWGRDQLTPTEEWRQEQEQAERDEREDREEEIHEPTEDER